MGTTRLNIRRLLTICGLFLVTAAAVSLEDDPPQRTSTHRSLINRATSELPPTPGSDGLCYNYTVQPTDTCQSIAKAHDITAREIDSYNTDNWRWQGCGNIKQGDFICLSSGEPPMPVALPHATCGPQVPGTARPSDYGILSSLNPCPSGECCSVQGDCASGSDVCLSDSCIWGCGAKSTPKTTAEATKTTAKETTKETTEAETKTTSKDKTTTEVKPAAETTTTKAEKTTEAKTTSKDETTSKAETTTKAETTSKAKATTASSKPPDWSLAAYTGLNCDGDYYVLEGYSTDDSKCVDIHGGLSTEDSGSGVSCIYFTDGGFTSSDCASSPDIKIWSWILTGATCEAYSNATGCTGEVADVHPHDGGCQAETWRRPHYWMTWRSLQCSTKK